jgi:uncharacterized membrane protein
LHWLVAIHIAVVLFSVAMVLDKHLVVRMFPSSATFNVVFGLLQFIVAPAFLVTAVFTVGFDGGSGIPWAIATGLAWGFALSLFFAGLRLEEVSRAAPISASAPVFVALIAVVLFGESLTLFQWSAILAVVLGAALVSAQFDGWTPRIARGRALAMLVASAIFMSIGITASDQAVERMNVWAVQGFRSFSMGLTVIALTWRPSMHRQMLYTMRRGRAVGALFVTEGVIGPLAQLTFLMALTQGSVAVVTAVVSSGLPLLVLLLTIALSTKAWNVLNESLDRQTLGPKAFATALIVAGVATLAIV